MPTDNTAQLIDSARRRHELTRAKAIRALRELSRAQTPVTFGIVPGEKRLVLGRAVSERSSFVRS